MNEKLLQVMSTPMTNQHEPGTEAASAKGEYAGTDSGLEADVGISMAAAVEAENKRGRASLSFLGPLITSTARKRAEILAGAWDYGPAQISHRFAFMRHEFEINGHESKPRAVDIYPGLRRLITLETVRQVA